jgi:hypothetical protein
MNLFPKMRSQRGQAMAEFVVVAVLVLVPLYLLIPVLGKYIDMKGASVVGARYAAWERTVYYAGAAASVDWPGVEKSDAEIRNEVRQRIFSQGTSIAATDKGATNWGGGGYRASWVNRDGSGMLPNYNAVTQATLNSDSPGIANDVLNLIVTVADALGPFTLETKGLYSAEVAVSANTLPINFSFDGEISKAFNPGKLTFSDRSAVLANGWSAKGSDHVKSQTQGLTPTGVFQTPVGNVILKLIQAVVGIAMPEIWLLELGKIEPDVVPEDRVVAP